MLEYIVVILKKDYWNKDTQDYNGIKNWNGVFGRFQKVGINDLTKLQ